MGRVYGRLRAMARLWNGVGDPADLPRVWSALWPALQVAWSEDTAARQQRWASQPDLVSSLLGWAARQRADGLG